MTERNFTQKELNLFRELGHSAIVNELTTGFNYYPESIELKFQDSITIPIKCGHREDEFFSALKREVLSRYGNSVTSELLPRRVIYKYDTDQEFDFPKPETGIRIYDIKKGKYVKTKEDYKTINSKLLAEGEESSLVFLTETGNLVDLANFLISKANLFMINETGGRISAPPGSEEKFVVNKEGLKGAYRIPMIVTSYNLELERRLPKFSPVKKLYKIKGREEINTFVDKTHDKFVKNCRIKFDGTKIMLANKVFRDYINFAVKE